MHVLPILVTAPAAALAGAVIEVRTVAPQIVQLQFHVDTATKQTALAIMDASYNNTLAHTCGNTLTSGPFSSLPISVEIDDEIEGTVSVGNSKYTVDSEPEFSGGITCDTMYVPGGEAFINCEVPLPGDLKLEPINTDGLPNCFSSQGVTMLGTSLIGAPTAVDTIGRKDFPLVDPVPEELPDDAEVTLNDTSVEGALEKRQCGVVQSRCKKVGNGNPHMNHFHKQISENMDCGGGRCSVSFDHTKSFTISAQFGGSQWITGGFSVQYSWVTGNKYQCSAKANQRVCNWYDTAHTAYTVKTELYSGQGCPVVKTGQYIIWSPNKNNRGGKHYCVRGKRYCRNLGAHYWDKTPRPP